MADATMMSERNSQPNSSKGLANPIIHLMETLLSESAQKCIVPGKLHAQKAMGKVSADWWCVTDSIFNSLQKIIKIKRTAEDPKHNDESKRSSSPNKRNNQSNTNSPAKEDKKKEKK